MYVQPLQLEKSEMIIPVINDIERDTPVKRILRVTRQTKIITEALARTPLRFTLVKPATSRLFVA